VWLSPLHAEQASISAALHTSDKPYIQATGEATLSVKPDQALIDIGVVTEAPTAVAAAAQNAKQSDRLLSDLRRILGENGQLRTTSYSVRPNFKYPKPGAAIALAGYIATNVVTVVLENLGQVGKTIDLATESGANAIRALDYRLKDPQAIRAQALRDAAARAKASADAIASGLGLRVVKVISVEEGALEEASSGSKKKAPPPPPPGGAPATQIEPDVIDVTAAVTLRVEIGQ
jgi:uncharacterized protein YggE